MSAKERSTGLGPTLETAAIRVFRTATAGAPRSVVSLPVLAACRELAVVRGGRSAVRAVNAGRGADPGAA